MSRVSTKARFGYGAMAAFGGACFALGAGLCMAISGGGGDNEPAAQNLIRSDSYEYEQRSPLDDGKDEFSVGQRAVTGGVAVTVKDIETVSSLPWTEFGAKPQRPAAGDKKLIRVDTEVENTGATPMMLSCGSDLFVEARAGDQSYKPVRTLYHISGNPQCLEPLRPGLKRDMVWAFEVPADDEVSAVGFTDGRGRFRNALVEVQGAE